MEEHSMSLGDSSWNAVAGGGQQKTNSAQLSKSLLQFGVCTGPGPTSIVNQLLQPGDQNSLLSLAGAGPLVEAAVLRLRLGLSCYIMPVPASQPGGVSAVSLSGTGAGTITPSGVPHVPIGVLCDTGGALGTAAFRFSVAGSAYGPVVTSVGGGPWVYNVPGTFCSLSFAAATYVATKTLSVGVDGTVTPGSAWVGTVTQTSSPLDFYDVYAQVVTGGALGTAVLAISLDGGPGPTGGGSFLPPMLVPTNGKVPLPGTGLLLTCASTFNGSDYYTFVASPPSCTTSELNAAVLAARQLRNVQFEQLHSTIFPATAAGAASQLSTLDTAITTANAADGLDWGGMVECPSAAPNSSGFGDIVMSGSAAIRDTADTDAVIIAARGTDTNRTALHVGMYRIASPITGRKQLRPAGWAVAARFVDTEPAQDLSALQPLGALPIYIPAGALTIGRDEMITPGIDAVSFNTLRTYRGRTGAYLSITSSGSGWKNASTTAVWQDKGFVRILNVAIATLRPIAQNFLGQRPPVNGDGTIEESTRRAWSTIVDQAFKKAVGLLPGGGFATGPQASFASAVVSPSSQLGAAPRLLVINYTLVSLGFVSAVQNNMYFSNTLAAAA
jgi:hypothetical protein